MSYKTRGLMFDQFNVGDLFESQGRTVTEADTVNFAGISGDYNPLHTDEEFGKTTPMGGRIAHGVLALAISTGQGNQLGIFEGTTIALMSQTVKYTGPVHFGDTIHLELKVAEKKESSKPDRGTVIFNANVVNQQGKTVIEGQWVCLMKRAC